MNKNLNKSHFGTTDIFLFKKLNVNVAVKTVKLERSSTDAVVAEAKFMFLLRYGFVNNNNKTLIQPLAEKVNGKWHKEKNLWQFVKETVLGYGCLE